MCSTPDRLMHHHPQFLLTVKSDLVKKKILIQSYCCGAYSTSGFHPIFLILYSLSYSSFPPSLPPRSKSLVTYKGISLDYTKWIYQYKLLKERNLPVKNTICCKVSL